MAPDAETPDMALTIDEGIVQRHRGSEEVSRGAGSDSQVASIVGLQPDDSALIKRNSPDSLFLQPLGKGIGCEASAREAVQPLFIGAPEARISPSKDLVVELQTGGSDICKLVRHLFPLQDPFMREDPDMAGGVTRDSQNIDGIGLEDPVMVAGQASAFDGQPKVAIRCRIHAGEPVRRDAGCIAPVEDGEANSVGPGQSVQGGDP